MSASSVFNKLLVAIETFIDWKVEEEKKVAALIAAGYSSDYEGEAYKTVSGQNSNNSVRIPNAFFEKLAKGEDWELIGRMDGRVMKKVSSKKRWFQRVWKGEYLLKDGLLVLLIN